jgi:hypothetical protein
MIRLLVLAALMGLAAPASSTERPDETVVAQERPQQQAPRRDCEKRQEGVS